LNNPVDKHKAVTSLVLITLLCLLIAVLCADNKGTYYVSSSHSLLVRGPHNAIISQFYLPSSQPTSLRYILMLYSQLSLTTGHYQGSFLTKIQKAFLVSLILANSEAAL